MILEQMVITRNSISRLMKKNKLSISFALALVLFITLTAITSGLGFLNYRNTRNTQELSGSHMVGKLYQS